MSRCLTSFLAALALSLLAFALPGVASAERSTDPMAGAPKVGRCFDVSNKVAFEAASTTAPTVRCSNAHRLWITGTFEVPSGVKLDSDSAAFRTYFDKVCRPSALKALNASTLNYARSAYTLFHFVPTAAEQEAGARWITCMVGILAGPDRLMRTKGTVTVPSAPARKVRMCMDRSYNFTACANNHKYEQRHWKRVTTKPRKIKRITVGFCQQKFGNTRDWAWAYRPAKRKGDRYVYGILCFTP